MKQRISVVALSAVIFCCSFPAETAGQALGKGEPTHKLSDDLFDPTLEELAAMEITPINVLGSHTHLKGEWMFGYRYMYMDMQDNFKGSRKVSDQDVLADFPLVHTWMTMEMHMIEVMYAPTDNLTLMAMQPYRINTMDHLDRTGDSFETRSEGFGDLSLMALYNVAGNVREHGHRVLLNAGLSVPIGSIDEKDRGSKLEYTMQLGSGTFDLLPGLTYLGQTENWAWGAQALGTVRLGENENDYRLGNGYRLSAWGYYKVTDWFGPSLRFDWHHWGDIRGADPDLNPTRNPAFDPDKQSGQRLDFLAGLNFYASKGLLKGNRLSIEGGLPVYQSLDGPNLGVDWLITVGWSYSFH